MSVTLRQLEVFLAVAEECHFARAAERLHASQPVVSKEIQRLERLIGASLFDRSTRTVRLTTAGSALREDARAVLRASQAFTARAQRLSADRSRRLRVATTPSVIDLILPLIFRRAEEALPELILEEVAVETGEVSHALLHRGCDIGFGRYVTPPPGYATETIRHEQAYVALSSRHPLARATTIDPARLGDLPLLLWPREQNPAYHDRLTDICAERGLDPLLLVSPPRIVGARSYLIADNRAFGLVPQSTARKLTGDISVLPLTRPATLPLSIIWLENDPRPLLSGFVDLARRIGGELDAE